MTDDNKKQWYFNTVKKQAELGMVSPIEQRMGPYKTCLLYTSPSPRD